VATSPSTSGSTPIASATGIEPHVPVFDKSKRTDGTFSREDFTYDHQGDVYVCPAGKMLICKGTVGERPQPCAASVALT
jgi:hypothetical protein